MTGLMELLRSLIGARFNKLTPAQLIALGARLLPVVPDLAFDGDPHLSAESRLLIQDVVAAFEKDVLK